MSPCDGAPAGGSYEFIGTPDQADLGDVHWTKAYLELLGPRPRRRGVDAHARRRDVAYTVQIGDQVPSRIAQRLADCLAGQTVTGCAVTGTAPTTAFGVAVRIGLLGDSRMIITDASAFAAGLAITPAAGQSVAGRATISGVTTELSAAQWTQAALRIITPAQRHVDAGRSAAMPSPRPARR